MRPSDSDVRTKRRAEIAARKSFEGHVLKDEGHGRWYCARPDTNNYSFRVTDFRDGLILSGDLGELILVVYGRNPIAWLRGCLRSGNEDYVLSKVPLALRQRDMIEDLVLEFFRDSVGNEDEEKIVKNLRDSWDIHEEEAGTELEHIPDLTEDEWVEAFYEAGGCDEVPSVSDWSTHTLIQLEALKWFCAALERNEVIARG